MTKPEEMRRHLAEHLALTRAAREGNEFVDIRRALDLHQKLDWALDQYEDLTTEQQALVEHAVEYFARIEDDEDDFRSPIGFDDDEEVVDAAIEAIRSERGGTGSGSLST